MAEMRLRSVHLLQLFRTRGSRVQRSHQKEYHLFMRCYALWERTWIRCIRSIKSISNEISSPCDLAAGTKASSEGRVGKVDASVNDCNLNTLAYEALIMELVDAGHGVRGIKWKAFVSTRFVGT
jgi:hypothetical protein